jgi:hypothetical protein
VKVYRLERVNNHKLGPFQSHKINPVELMMGTQTALQDAVTPAEAARIVGQVFGGANPFDMPTILNDAPVFDVMQFVNSHNRDFSDYVFGFSSLEQYHEWFETRKQRQALFDYDKEDPVELRVFEVSDDQVYVSPHQVMFPLDIAKEGEVISRAKAIK